MTQGTLDNCRERIRDHWQGRYDTFGASLQSLSWGSASSQQRRFQVLLGVADLTGRTVQDIGCGFGDFVRGLAEAGMQPAEYVGVDVTPGMLDTARARYPEHLFELADVLSPDYTRTTDYVVASGVFATGPKPWQPYVETMLRRLFGLCRMGLAFNMQSIWGEHCFHDGVPEDRNYDPLYWLDFCRRELSPRVTMRHDYMPHDATFYVYKEPFI